MDADSIVAEFKRLWRGDLQSTSYLIIMGPGGVGKTVLLSRLRRFLETKGAFLVEVDSDIEPDSAAMAASMSSQVLQHGYVGSCATSLRTLASPPSARESGATDQPDPVLADLPLFQSLRPGLERRDPKTSSRAEEVLGNALRDVCSTQKVTLFADLSVATSSQETWLARLIDLTRSPLLTVIACRQELAYCWPQGSDSASFTSLEPWKLEETARYLQECTDIKDDYDTKELFDLTEGYPLFLSHAANLLKQNLATSPRTRSRNLRRAITRKVRECFFREVANPDTQELARYAALCRIVTRDALLLVANKQMVEKHYDELLECSFVIEEPAGIGMLPILRRALLDEWHLQSPEAFKQANARLLKHYETLQDVSTSPDKLSAMMGVLYHELCLDERKGLAGARRVLFEAEERYDLSSYRAILKEIAQYPYRRLQSREWVKYWSTPLARMECRWTDVEQICRELMEDGSTAILRAHGHYGLAQILKLGGNWNEADKHFQIALDRFRSSHDQQLRFLSLVLRGSILTRRHMWREALDVLNESLTLVPENNVYELFVVHLNLGKLYRSQGNWEAAIERFSQALELAEETDNNNYFAAIYLEMGKLHKARDEFDRAVEFLQRCLRLRRELEDRLGEAICLHSLGTALMRKGNLQQAKKCYEDSLEIKETLGDKYGSAKSLVGLGHIERLTGKWLMAVNLYKKAWELFEETGNQAKSSRVLCRLGMTYADQGQWEEALNHLEQSRTIRLRSRDRQGVSESLLELGRIHDRQGYSEDALESFRLSAGFARDSSSVARIIPPSAAQARTLFRLGRLTGAILAAQEAQALAKRLSRVRQLADEYFKWGEEDWANGLYEVAFFSFGEALQGLTAAGENIDRYCDLFSKYLQESAEVMDEEVADHYAREVLRRWDDASQVGSLMRSVIATELYTCDENDKSLYILTQVCERLARELSSNRLF
jgi:tetratricopeptide (TPR) repeat protein